MSCCITRIDDSRSNMDNDTFYGPCKWFLLLLTYMTISGVGYVLINHAFTLIAFSDAYYNGHEDNYNDIVNVTLNTIIVIFVVNFMFLILTILLVVYSSIIRIRAGIGVFGSILFWMGFLCCNFSSVLMNDNGKLFRCDDSYKLDNRNTTIITEYLENDDKLANCFNNLDNSLLQSILIASICVMIPGLLAIILSAAYSQIVRKVPVPYVTCELCCCCEVRPVRFYGEVIWYIFFPMTSVLWIIASGNDYCLSDTINENDRKPLQEIGVISSNNIDV